jgi:hypothetical protein
MEFYTQKSFFYTSSIPAVARTVRLRRYLYTHLGRDSITRISAFIV